MKDSDLKQCCFELLQFLYILSVSYGKSGITLDIIPSLTV